MAETTNQNASMDKKRRELISVLNQFYTNPVAKASTELFLTVGLILFLGVFAIRPTIITMSDLLKEIETKKQLDDQLTKKIASLQTAQNQYLNIQDNLPLLEQAIPDQPQVIYTAKIIEKIAASSNVIIENLIVEELPEDISVTVPFSQKSKQLLNVSVRIMGDYVSIRSFVENLRTSRKSFVVESVVFSLEDDRGDKKLSANITIGAPYFGVAPAGKTAEK